MHSNKWDCQLRKCCVCVALGELLLLRGEASSPDFLSPIRVITMSCYRSTTEDAAKQKNHLETCIKVSVCQNSPVLPTSCSSELDVILDCLNTTQQSATTVKMKVKQKRIKKKPTVKYLVCKDKTQINSDMAHVFLYHKNYCSLFSHTIWSCYWTVFYCYLFIVYYLVPSVVWFSSVLFYFISIWSNIQLSFGNMLANSLA